MRYPVLVALFLTILYLLWAHPPLYGNTGITQNSYLTPGVVNPSVTQANIQQTICVSGWTATIRPTSAYTTKLKIQQIKQYGYADTKPGDYEEDHLISLELGGNPTDPRNLWPQSYDTTPNAHNKDQVENLLKTEVCNGTITLAEAQQEVLNWAHVYDSIKNSYGSIGLDDPDDL